MEVKEEGLAIELRTDSTAHYYLPCGLASPPLMRLRTQTLRHSICVCGVVPET